jgi:SOS-response transcriptional repressor LexA
MQEAGILPGDFVIVDRALRARVGDVVIAQVDGKHTLKFLQRDAHGKFFLVSGNARYPDTFPQTELIICGVVRSAIRYYR